LIDRLLDILLLYIIVQGQANGLRYPLVGGTRQRHFDGINFKSHKVLENAQTPTSQVHAVLGGGMLIRIYSPVAS